MKKKTLAGIFSQFILQENDSFVQKVVVNEIEPLIKSQSHDVDLIYDDYDAAKNLMQLAKLQSSIAAYIVIVFKYAPTPALASFVPELLLHQPILMYTIHWASVFLKESEAQKLFEHIMKFRVVGMSLTSTVRPLIDTILLDEPTLPVLPQLRQVYETYTKANSATSIGKLSKVNWEKLETLSRWGNTSMPSAFKALSIDQAKMELIELNVIAYINSMPFADELGIDRAWLEENLRAKMPKGLMPPTVLYKTELNANAVNNSSFAPLFQELIFNMFTHKGIKKIPGMTHIGIDWSGSMKHPIASGGGGRMERRHAAILMAYMLSLVCEECEIWFSGDTSAPNNGKDIGLHIKLNEEDRLALFENIFSMDAGDKLERKYKLQGGGIFEYDFFATVEKDIKSNPSHSASNIFLFCDGEECDNRLQVSWRGDSANKLGDTQFPVITACKRQFVMNVQAHAEKYGTEVQSMFTRIHGHSDYFLEWICQQNGIANPMEKGDTNSTVSFRNQ
jgi:hypothetical protein